MPKCCVLAGTSWYIETFTRVVVTCVGFPIAFGNDRLEKPVNMRDTNYVTPPHCPNASLLDELSTHKIATDKTLYNKTDYAKIKENFRGKAVCPLFYV